MATESYKPALAYRALTPLYDVALELIGFGAAFKRHVAVLLDVRPGETVLDLGCGTGTLLAALADAQPSAAYVGVDPDPAVLGLAQRRLAQRRLARRGLARRGPGGRSGHVRLVHGYAQHLPLPDARFDAVVSTLVFHHLPDTVKTQTLTEVRRVLRPGGRFLLVDLSRPQGRFGRALLGFGSLFDGWANTRASRRGELPGLLAAAGFEVTEAATPYRAVRYLLARPRADHGERGAAGG